jgi:hypothetical protein
MTQKTSFKKLSLKREDKDNLVFVTCDQLEGFFFSTKKGLPIRAGLDRLLRHGYAARGQSAQVYINGSVSKKTIHAIVELTDQKEEKTATNVGRSIS